MPAQEYLNPARFGPATGPFSQGVKVGDLVFVAGQTASDGSGGVLAPGDVREQTRLVIERIRDVLAEAGGGLEQVVSATSYLVDISDFGAYNQAWVAAFGDLKPARATVRAELAIPGLLVEISAIAHLGT